MPETTENKVTVDTDKFVRRHIGPGSDDVERMLERLGLKSLEELIDRAVPEAIRFCRELDLEPARTEVDVLEELRLLASRNERYRNFIGMGYDECITPPAIQRGILENPGWYTAYTPYQPEIAQGRLTALLNFQTMISDLTGLPVANSSLLDEGTAAAEAMTLCLRMRKRGQPGNVFFVSENCHPQTIAVVRTRALPLGLDLVVGDHRKVEWDHSIFGALVQYPATDGTIHEYEEFCRRAHEKGALVVVAADLLALTLLRGPGEFGADIAVGSSQRFGQPLGYGGPHAAYMACAENCRRQVPGRVVGISRDAEGNPAVRLALQTREQHIRRDKATSNICTAQVLLAVMASMYAVYHGPEGLKRIATRIHRYALVLAEILRNLGHEISAGPFFDTVKVTPAGMSTAQVMENATARKINLRVHDDGGIGISLGETARAADLVDLHAVFGGERNSLDDETIKKMAGEVEAVFPEGLHRTSMFMNHPVFHRYRCETELMRYMHRLASMDLALNAAMIPLGSCTMKLNAAAEMYPISDPGFASIHPFAPSSQTAGYEGMLLRLSRWLEEMTGFSSISFMPNSGAQGEYTGLQVIREYHRSRGEDRRDVCLIPESAHGTNPASAVLAGMKVVVVKCDELGNIDTADLKARAEQHADSLGALMVTYPSTHGVFEESITEICNIIHHFGGQVYMDGANMNAMVGICRIADIGADVCHLNLHKTYSIPHGGGGPGMGPIGVAAHLENYLPSHPEMHTGTEEGIGPVSSAPFGSPSILPISYAYIAMMGAEGLKRASQVAILAANYIASRLQGHYELLYRGRNGFVAHECILDTRPFREVGVSVDDIAKRLMDYGFHAPTMSWPVAGTLMVEPTESESLEELDRFCEAMIGIREEIREIESGRADPSNNVLTNAPHTARIVSSDDWDRPYSREKAAYPTDWQKEHKFWPAVARVDNPYGDRNFVCVCPPVEEYD